MLVVLVHVHGGGRGDGGGGWRGGGEHGSGMVVVVERGGVGGVCGAWVWQSWIL